MRLLGLSVLTAGIALAACGTEGSSAEQQGADVVTAPRARGVCEAMLLGLSRQRMRCVLERAPTVLYLGEQDRLECAALDRAIAAGRVVVDATRLAACESELAAAGCDATWSATIDPTGACASLFRRVDPDTACEVHLECGAGRYCEVRSTFCAGTCRALPGLGEACGKGWECGYGLACTSFAGSSPVCSTPVHRPLMPVALAGEPCDDETLCEPSATCTGDRCVVHSDIGGACNTNDDCAVGICAAALCSPHQPVGGACQTDDDCARSLTCTAGACAAKCD